MQAIFDPIVNSSAHRSRSLEPARLLADGGKLAGSSAQRE
jgi:hypothetical protein